MERIFTILFLGFLLTGSSAHGEGVCPTGQEQCYKFTLYSIDDSNIRVSTVTVNDIHDRLSVADPNAQGSLLNFLEANMFLLSSVFSPINEVIGN